MGKKFRALALALMLVLAAGFGRLFAVPLPSYENKWDRPPDLEGSWRQISEDITRGADWKQIVQNSPFQLGEIISRQEPGYDGSEQEHNGYLTRYYQKYGTYPAIDGSTVAVPMAVEFARQHLGLSDERIRGFASFYTTHVAYRRLICKESGLSSYIPDEQSHDTLIWLDQEHMVDIILATEPSDEELRLAEENDVTLIKEPICWDAFVFITHKDNPVDSLTIEQIQKIYMGEITSWRELGGDGKKITAYQREENSGSQTAMENLVMKGLPMIEAPKARMADSMAGLIEAVADYKADAGSIGYTYKCYIDNLYRNDNIKVLQIDGIEPSDANIRSQSYPFSTNYYGVIRRTDRNNTGGKFLDWMLSDEGQRCIAQAGYIPMRAT